MSKEIQENWLKKISAKTVCGDIKVLVPEKGSADIFSIMGIAHGIKITPTQYGDAVGFTGDFEAINIQTGEVFRSPVAYIPEPAQGLISAKIQNNNAVEFSFIVSVKKSDKGGVGYEFTVKPINSGKQADALKELREQTRAALPAPTKAK